MTKRLKAKCEHLSRFHGQLPGRWHQRPATSAGRWVSVHEVLQRCCHCHSRNPECVPVEQALATPEAAVLSSRPRAPQQTAQDKHTKATAQHLIETPTLWL